MRDSIVIVSNYDIWAESFRQWADKEMSLLTILTIAGVVVLLVVLVVLYEVNRSNRVRRELQDLAWKKFEYSAKRLKLNLGCMGILKAIALGADLQDPDSMLKSPHVFEIALEKYYKNKKIESIASEKLEEIRNLRKILGFLPLSKEIAYSSTRQFVRGEKCKVQIPENGPETHKGMCDIVGSEEINWSIIRPDGPPVPPGTWISVNLTRPGDAEYDFKVQVLRDSKGELLLSHAIELNRTQQRNWARADVNIPVEIIQMGRDGVGDIFFGKIIDMSGGGFGMALPIKLIRGTELKLNFELPGHGRVDQLPVTVVRVAGPYNNDSSKTVHSVAIDGEVHAIQEQIIQYVFEKQRQDSLIKNI